MTKKQLSALFLCSLIPWTIGSGLTPLLPVYAGELGAPPALAGCQLSLSYLALAVGTLSAGWLSDKLQHRKVLVVMGGLVSIPALWSMGYVADLWALTAVSAVWYFSAGMSVTLINILAGLFAEESARGKVFGILALNSGIGSLIGGLVMGPIADHWGYPSLFAVLCPFGLAWPMTGLILKDSVSARARGTYEGATEKSAGLGKDFYLLAGASLAGMLASYVFIMGRSLVMDDLGFGATAISTTSAISQVPVLPLPLLIGWLSDRFGSRRFLILGYLAALVGLLGLAASTSLWHFWTTSTLITISFITRPVGTALVADLVPQRALGRGLSLFGTTTWIAGILGCASAGCAVQYLGPVPTFAAGALLPLGAVVLLLAFRRPHRVAGSLAMPSGSTSIAEPLSARAQPI